MRRGRGHLPAVGYRGMHGYAQEPATNAGLYTYHNICSFMYMLRVMYVSMSAASDRKLLRVHVNSFGLCVHVGCRIKLCSLPVWV